MPTNDDKPIEPPTFHSTLNSLSPVDRETLINYTDKDSPTYNRKGRSVHKAKPHLAHEQSASAIATDTFKRPEIKTALAEIYEGAMASYEVRTRHLADLALGRVQNRTITEQVKLLEDGSETVVAKSVVTRDTPAAVQLAGLAKISRDTGEDTVVSAQNDMLNAELRKMGRDMLRAHQRAVSPPQSAEPSIAVQSDADTLQESVEPAHTTLTTPDIVPTIPDDTDSHDVSISIQGAGPRARGGSGGLASLFPSPPFIPEQKKSGPLRKEKNEILPTMERIVEEAEDE